jgi:hypothetical protein
VSEAVGWLLALGQQVWQEQRRDEGASVCLISVLPFLLGAAAVGLRLLDRRAKSWGVRARGRRKLVQSAVAVAKPHTGIISVAWQEAGWPLIRLADERKVQTAQSRVPRVSGGRVTGS